MKQGGITSTVDYKAYLDDLINQYEGSKAGTTIRSIYVGAPACADDVILLASDLPSVATLTNITYNYACRERYTIHPEKTVLSVFYTHPVWEECVRDMGAVRLGENAVPVVNCITHLGINRYNNINDKDKFILERLALGRRTSYSLMGAGFHGVDGIPPNVCCKLYHTYVLPRILYGLETMVLSRSQIDQLEVPPRRTLRAIQRLPIRTASAAVHLLIGALPIEAALDKSRMKMFGSISRREGSKINELAWRHTLGK